jgi:hypothetical protein
MKTATTTPRMRNVIVSSDTGSHSPRIKSARLSVASYSRAAAIPSITRHATASIAISGSMNRIHLS